MRGKVKWFSTEKGYGFVTGDDDIDRFVNVQAVKGADLPASGDVVEFEHQEGKKGPRGKNVTIVKRGSRGSAKQDDRVTCSHCERRMVPRVVFNGGSANHSICPFCGKMYKDFEESKLKPFDNSCFIATAVYGDYSAEPVIVLREFRDNVLVKTKLGWLLIRIYYRNSPPIARFISQHKQARYCVRNCLDKFVLMLLFAKAHGKSHDTAHSVNRKVRQQ